MLPGLINNTLDLMFMGMFIILGIVILFLNSNMSHYEDYTYNIVVNTLGGVGFLLFCVVIIFQPTNVRMCRNLTH